MDFIREGFYVVPSWFIINCILDILMLLPLGGMKMPTWFAHIRVRYLMMPVMSISIGYMAAYHKAS